MIHPPNRAVDRIVASFVAAERVTWLGHVADRAAYLEHLGAADAFFPSPAEGFPKVVLDSLAVGLPVMTTDAGALRGLVAADLVGPIDQSTSTAVLTAWRRLVATPRDQVEDRR